MAEIKPWYFNGKFQGWQIVRPGKVNQYRRTLVAARRLAGPGAEITRKNPSRRKNSGKKPSKLQRLLSSTKRAKQKRMAKALNEYLKVRNPGTKLAGAKVIKNAGGSITIIPIKLRRAK